MLDSPRWVSGESPAIRPNGQFHRVQHCHEAWHTGRRDHVRGVSAPHLSQLDLPTRQACECSQHTSTQCNVRRLVESQNSLLVHNSVFVHCLWTFHTYVRIYSVYWNTHTVKIECNSPTSSQVPGELSWRLTSARCSLSQPRITLSLTIANNVTWPIFSYSAAIA